MSKNLFIPLGLLLYSLNIFAIDLQLSAGLSEFKLIPSQSFDASPIITDTLVNPRNHRHLGLNFKILNSLNHYPHLKLGLSFAQIYVHQKADVWEFNRSLFDNYRANIRSNIQIIMLEAIQSFDKVMNFNPYVSAGLGVSFIKTHYDDDAIPSIPTSTELHHSNATNKGTLSLGGGIGYAINDMITLDCHYQFLVLGRTTINPNSELNSSIQIPLSNHSIWFGITYKV